MCAAEGDKARRETWIHRIFFSRLGFLVTAFLLLVRLHSSNLRSATRIRSCRTGTNVAETGDVPHIRLSQQVAFSCEDGILTSDQGPAYCLAASGVGQVGDLGTTAAEVVGNKGDLRKKKKDLAPSTRSTYRVPLGMFSKTQLY